MVNSQSEYFDRRTVLKTGGVAVAVALAGCGDGGDEGEIVEWHAGGEGGTYFPLSNEFKNIVDDETEFSLQVQSTGASVENVGSLASEDADFALIQNDIASFARNGTGIDTFQGDPVENLRGVATLYPETIHLITRPGVDVDSVADLEGLSVNTGDLGSGTQVNALQILEAAGGLQPGDDFDEQNASFSSAADQIRDGDVDASFVVGGWPVGAVEELADAVDIGLVDFSGDDLQASLDAAEWFAEDTIPGGTYSGIDEDVTTVSVQAMIATHSGVAANTVETVTNAIFDNLDQLTLKTDFISRDTALDGMPIELHEGAEGLFD